MATLPDSAGFGTELVLASQPSLTWLIDKEQNQVSRMDEGLEAVRQAVEIALSVERYRWQIYSTNFGAELDDLVGEDEAYIVSELPRLIEEALSTDDRIRAVDDFSFSRTDGNSMTVTFAVHTVFGDISEVMQI
jgi:hypothetical protein